MHCMLILGVELFIHILGRNNGKFEMWYNRSDVNAQDKYCNSLLNITPTLVNQIKEEMLKSLK